MTSDHQFEQAMTALLQFGHSVAAVDDDDNFRQDLTHDGASIRPQRRRRG